MKTQFDHKFNITDEVFHLTPDSNKGIIVDISFSILTNLVLYQVASGGLGIMPLWYYEHELSETKIF